MDGPLMEQKRNKTSKNLKGALLGVVFSTGLIEVLREWSNPSKENVGLDPLRRFTEILDATFERALRLPVEVAKRFDLRTCTFQEGVQCGWAILQKQKIGGWNYWKFGKENIREIFNELETVVFPQNLIIQHQMSPINWHIIALIFYWKNFCNFLILNT